MEAIPFPLDDGINRSVSGAKSSLGSIYTMENMRHSITNYRRLEQTPYWRLLYTLAQGTYYNAGSQTEPSSSSVTMCTKSLYMTEYCYSDGSTQIKAFYQTAPATETVFTGCLLVINSIASLGINLGAALDVEMTAAAAFRWRKNGGGWTAGVPSTAGVSIDGGNATLYFLANTGFAGTEVWAWTRLDRSWSTTVSNPADDGTPGPYFYKGQLYFTCMDRRMCVAKKDSSNVTYVISLGYRPVFCSYFTFFQDHLVVGGYGTTGSYSWQISPGSKTLAWSDVTDVENFVPTDVNEADTFTLPNNTTRDILSNTATDSFVTGLAVIGDVLFAFTTFGAYQTPYYGLPLVFSFTRSLEIAMPAIPGPNVAKAVSGVYLLTQDDVVYFDGSTIKSIGSKILPYLGEPGSTSGIVSRVKTSSCGLMYNSSIGELALSPFNSDAKLFYQEKYGTWYSRTLNTTGGLSGRPSAYGISNADYSTNDNLYLVGLPTRRVWIEDITWQNQPQLDNTGGTVYTTPTIIFNPVCYKLSDVKELIGLYIGATLINFSLYGGSVPSSTYYSIGSNIRAVLSWQLCPAGVIDDAVAYTTDSTAYWDSNKVDGLISFPRISFRGLSLRITITGQVNGKPPGYINITDVEPIIRQIQAQYPTR